MEALLEADASVDDEDNEGKTALHFATDADIVVALIMAGADVDHEDHKGKTPGRLALDRMTRLWWKHSSMVMRTRARSTSLVKRRATDL